MLPIVFVIPCFNEARRLDAAQVAALVEPEWASALLVDDGSTDGTRELLENLAANSGGKIRTLVLSKNQGKAEAVRQGLLMALAGAPLVGFADADFATPPSELLRLGALLGESDADAVIGSRVALMGHRVRRKPSRHYLGRVFATVASGILQTPIYDTQCGAKCFRAGEPLRDALSSSFTSRWLFDVELLGRLLASGARLVEVPLLEWHDVDGSKLNVRSLARVPFELARIGFRLKHR